MKLIQNKCNLSSRGEEQSKFLQRYPIRNLVLLQQNIVAMETCGDS